MKKKFLGVIVLCTASLFAYNEFSSSDAEAANAKGSAQLGDMQIDIHSAKSYDKLVDGTGFIIEKPSSNNGEFVVIDATITNIGQAQLELDSQLVYNLITADGAVYEPTAIAFDDFLGVENINPGLSVTGQLAFEVPVGISDYELQIEANEANGTVSLP